MACSQWIDEIGQVQRDKNTFGDIHAMLAMEGIEDHCTLERHSEAELSIEKLLVE